MVCSLSYPIWTFPFREATAITLKPDRHISYENSLAELSVKLNLFDPLDIICPAVGDQRVPGSLFNTGKQRGLLLDTDSPGVFFHGGYRKETMGYIAKLHDLLGDSCQSLRRRDQVLELSAGAGGVVVDLDDTPAGPLRTRSTALLKNEVPADSTTPLSISIWVTWPVTCRRS